MKIIITGYTGFVGSNLIKSLKNYKLLGLDIAKGLNVEKHYNWNELRDCSGMDVIIHLAGKAHDTKNSSSEKEYFDINLGLTQKIFDYFLKSQATKFIFFSSAKAIADEVEGETLKEEAIPSPQTPYGKSKLAAEDYILEAALPADKKVYILRPCMIHGAGNKGNLNLLYKVVKRGIPWPLGAFENKRSMVSIDNLTWIIRQIIEKDIEPGVYHVADDEPLSTNEIVELMSESMGRKPYIWRLNKRLLKGIAKTGDYFRLPLNSERLKKLTESYVVSNDKLKNALGVEKMPVNSKDGLKKTLSSF